MDERKRQIEQLEKNKQENRFSLDSLLERFGESLLSRVEDGNGDYEVVAEYCRLQNDVADSNTAIHDVEEQIRRLRELEDKIEQKEQEDKERAKDLSGVYRKLGKALLEDTTGAYTDLTAPFRSQAEALITKVDSLENRFTELDQKDGSNVFAWIGKSAQGLVLRSFLTKAQENLDQLYRSAGERCCRQEKTDESGEGFEGNEASPDMAALKEEVRKALNEIRILSEELLKLREEKRAINSGFSVDGNPLKQIQSLKNHIGRIKENLRVLYRNFGAQAASTDSTADLLPELKQFIDSLIAPDDKEVLDNAARLNRAIQDDEAMIGRLRASLAIDEEKAKIEKCRKSIDDKKVRIVEAEKAIADLEDDIKDSEKNIEELQKLL